MEREYQSNLELRKSYESKLQPDQSLKYLNQPTFIQAGLWYYTKYSNVRAQNFYQIYFAAELLKTLGNNYYKQQKIELALDAYQEAISIFRYIKPNKDAIKKNVLTDKDLDYVCYQSSSENENRKVKQIQHVLYLNLSIGYIKTQQYQNAIAACTFDLEIEPLSVKSLYRRSLARFQSNQRQRRDQDLKLAIADLKKALEVDPNDEDIKELLLQIEENQNFKKQNSDVDTKQQSDADTFKKNLNANNFNDNQSVSSSTSQKTANSTQKSLQSQSVLREQSTYLAPAQPQKQVETDLISAKSTPQTLEKINNIPLQNNDQSKENENKENNNNQQQNFANYKEYLLKTQPSYQNYYNRLQQFADKQKQGTEIDSNKNGVMESSKASAASILSNIKNNNNNNYNSNNNNNNNNTQQKQQQQQQQQKQQKPKKFKEEDEEEYDYETIDEREVSPQQKQQQKQLSSQTQKQRAKEKKKNSEQAKILKQIEEEKEMMRKREQEIELQRLNQIRLQQQKEEEERYQIALKEQELARQTLKSKIIDPKTTIKKGGRKIKNTVAPATLKQQPTPQQTQREQALQQQQLMQQMYQKQEQIKSQANQSVNVSQNNSKKANLKPKAAVFEEDDLFNKREEERLKQIKQQRGEDDEDGYYQNGANDPFENLPPYIPPNPSQPGEGEQLDLCEGSSILKQREKDKIFQHSYKSNYQDYLDQKHLLDSDGEVPEIPGLIPPSYKSYAQKRREELLQEKTSQEKKELSKFQKILIWGSLFIFIFTLWWAMGDDVPVAPPPPVDLIENDEFI